MSETRADAEARLISDIETSRIDEVERFLLEHLAYWGPGHLDVQALAERVIERVEEED